MTDDPILPVLSCAANARMDEPTCKRRCSEGFTTSNHAALQAFSSISVFRLRDLPLIWGTCCFSGGFCEVVDPVDGGKWRVDRYGRSARGGRSCAYVSSVLLTVSLAFLSICDFWVCIPSTYIEGAWFLR